MGSGYSAESDNDSRRQSGLVATVAVIEDYLGSPVRLGRRLPGCIANMVYEFWAGGRRMILKSGEDGGIRREYAVLHELDKRRLPAPRAELVKVPAGGSEVVLVMDAWDGAAAKADSPLLVEAGTVLRQLHDVQKNGFGPVDPGAAEVRGSHASWSAFAEHLLERAWAQIPEAVLNAELRDMTMAAVQESAGSVPDVAEGVLLHGDLVPKHIWCQGNRLVGLIDWGDAMIGDPMFDMARVSMAGPGALDLLMKGYGREGELDARLLSLYRLLWSLMALTVECEEGGDWFKSYLNIISEEANVLSRTGGLPKSGLSPDRAGQGGDMTGSPHSM